MRMGPVELKMMRGCPPNKQKTLPAKAVPRKLSITPYEKNREQIIICQVFCYVLCITLQLSNLVIVSSIP